jgi:hypothetical protein
MNTRYGEERTGDSEEGNGEVMTPLHFFGIWIIWLVFACGLLASRFGLYLYTHFGMFIHEKFTSKAGAGAQTQSTIQTRPQWEIDAQKADIDLNNPPSMLRYVISEMAEMQGKLNALQPTGRDQTTEDQYPVGNDTV